MGNGNLNHDALGSIIKPNLAVERGFNLALDEFCAEAAPCRWAYLRSPSGFKNDRLASNRPSIGREIFHALIRLFIGSASSACSEKAWMKQG